jgi:hypothetical protein
MKKEFSWLALAFSIAIFVIVLVVWAGLPSSHSESWFDYELAPGRLRRVVQENPIGILGFLLVIGVGSNLLGRWLAKKLRPRSSDGAGAPW